MGKTDQDPTEPVGSNPVASVSNEQISPPRVDLARPLAILVTLKHIHIFESSRVKLISAQGGYTVERLFLYSRGMMLQPPCLDTRAKHRAVVARKCTGAHSRRRRRSPFVWYVLLLRRTSGNGSSKSTEKYENERKHRAIRSTGKPRSALASLFVSILRGDPLATARDFRFGSEAEEDAPRKMAFICAAVACVPCCRS